MTTISSDPCLPATEKLIPPWEQYPRNAPPQHTVSLKLNAYQLEQLRYLVDHTDLSQNKIMKKMVVPILEARANSAYNAAHAVEQTDALLPI